MPLRTHLSKWTRRLAPVALIALAACPRSKPADRDAMPAAPGASVATVATAATAAPHESPIRQLAFADDGTLVAQVRTTLVAVAPGGTRTTLSFPDDTSFELPAPPSSDAAIARRRENAAIVTTGDTSSLVTLSPLRLVPGATGHSVMAGGPESASAIAAIVEMDKSSTEIALAVDLVVPGTSKVVRLRLPSRSPDVRAVDITASGRFAVITTVTESDGNGDEKARGLEYDLSTGAIVGDAIANRSIDDVPPMILDGDRQIGFRHRDLSIVDLSTGKTLRHARPPCRPGEGISLGNPKIDPTGRTLLVTCGHEGLLLDANSPSLAVLRTIHRILPGCDNGGVLPGHYSADGNQLIVEGCGGEAHLDLGTGRYVCGDDDGLMGRPYDMFGDDPDAGGKPKQAAGVPFCRPEGSARTEEKVSAHYAVVANDEGNLMVIKPGDASMHLSIRPGEIPLVSPTEDRYAVIDNASVVLYALPGGAVLSTLAF